MPNNSATMDCLQRLLVRLFFQNLLALFYFSNIDETKKLHDFDLLVN